MKKIFLAIIPLVAIAAIAIGVGMSNNVLAQPATSTPPTTVDQPDSPNDVADNHNATDATPSADNQKDGETNDDHNSTTKVTSGNDDGEQPDATERK